MKNISSAPVAFITGASSGIGKATAQLLAASGFRVFGTSRVPKAAPEVPYKLITLDVCSDDSVRAAVKYVIHQAGRIDLLINNAGYSQNGALEEISIADVQAQFETNVFGVLRVTNEVLPIMRQQCSGRIINVSSILGHVAPPFIGAYSASKFALEGISETLRNELYPFNIHVSVVEPSFVKTNIVNQYPTRPLTAYEARRQAVSVFVREGVAQGMEPSLIAQKILEIATTGQPRLHYPIGRTGRLLKLKRLLPEPIFERVFRRIFKTDAIPVLAGPQLWNE